MSVRPCCGIVVRWMMPGLLGVVVVVGKVSGGWWGVVCHVTAGGWGCQTPSCLLNFAASFLWSSFGFGIIYTPNMKRNPIKLVILAWEQCSPAAHSPREGTAHAVHASKHESKARMPSMSHLSGGRHVGTWRRGTFPALYKRAPAL